MSAVFPGRTITSQRSGTHASILQHRQHPVPKEAQAVDLFSAFPNRVSAPFRRRSAPALREGIFPTFLLRAPKFHWFLHQLCRTGFQPVANFSGFRATPGACRPFSRIRPLPKKRDAFHLKHRPHPFAQRSASCRSPFQPSRTVSPTRFSVCLPKPTARRADRHTRQVRNLPHGTGQHRFLSRG
jgi:hypothetical protein